MLSAEDAERSGALTDTRAFNAVCDDLGRAQQRADDLAAALRPMVAALDAFEAQYLPDELAGLDYDTHLIGGGISLADCRRARDLIGEGSATHARL